MAVDTPISLFVRVLKTAHSGLEDIYEKSVRPDILENVVHYARRTLVNTIPAEVHIKENS
jgi:hypothetical protein